MSEDLLPVFDCVFSLGKAFIGGGFACVFSLGEAFIGGGFACTGETGSMVLHTVCAR